MEGKPVPLPGRCDGCTRGRNGRFAENWKFFENEPNIWFFFNSLQNSPFELHAVRTTVVKEFYNHNFGNVRSNDRITGHPFEFLPITFDARAFVPTTMALQGRGNDIRPDFDPACGLGVGHEVIISTGKFRIRTLSGNRSDWKQD